MTMLFTWLKRGVTGGLALLLSSGFPSLADQNLVDNLPRIGVKLDSVSLRKRDTEYQQFCVEAHVRGDTCVVASARLAQNYYDIKNYAVAFEMLGKFRKHMFDELLAFQPCSRTEIYTINKTAYVLDSDLMADALDQHFGTERTKKSIRAFLCYHLRSPETISWNQDLSREAFKTYISAYHEDMSKDEVDIYLDSINAVLKQSLKSIGRDYRWWGLEFKDAEAIQADVSDAVRFSQLYKNAADAGKTLGLSVKFTSFLDENSVFYADMARLQERVKRPK